MKKQYKFFSLLIVSFLAIFFYLAKPAVAAPDYSFPVAPPASSLKVSDLFVVSGAKPANVPNNSRLPADYPQAVIVTPKNTVWQVGGIWSKKKIDLAGPFTYDTWHYFGDKTGRYGAADGMAFVLQNDPAGQSAYGSPGGGLGVYPWSTDGSNHMISNYVRNALAIEMDTWWNVSGVADDQFDLGTANTENTGHLGVVRPGDTPLTTKNSSQVGHLQYIPVKTPLANNKWRHFQVSWVPKVTYVNGIRTQGGTLTYTLDDDPTQGSSYEVKDVNKVFGGTQVYYGYTGATGAHPTFQSVALLKAPQSAQPITLNFVDKDSGSQITTPITMAGEPGITWDGSSRRQAWIQDSSGNWYHYIGEYTANTPDGKDQGTFSATAGYVVNYKYEKKQPPADFALSKQVRNDSAADPVFSNKVEAKPGDTVTYQLDYANLTGISNGEIKDQLDADLEYQTGSLKLADDDNNHQFTPIDDSGFISGSTIKFPYALQLGQGFSLQFQAKVKADAAGDQDIDNQATASNGSNSVTSNTAIVHLPQVDGSVTFRYLDRESDMSNPTKLSADVVVTGQVGKVVSALNSDLIRPKAIKDWTVVDYTQDIDLSSATYQQAEKIDPTISKENQVITYRYERAMLKLDADPILDFGRFSTAQSNETYYLGTGDGQNGKFQPYGVTVSDFYGVDGWQLSVQQNGQFKSDVDPNSTNPDLTTAHDLDDATLQFQDAAVERITGSDDSAATVDDSDSMSTLTAFNLNPAATTSSVVLTQSKQGHFKDTITPSASSGSDPEGTKYDNSGINIWRLSFGSGDDAKYGVGLHVPDTTKRYPTHYQTTLTWTLALTP
ncbi:lectin-like domain-containing protein [Loigolactobacillus zhaoyuanensis]|uniref:lectin-like domain-containing protein n=1 Tax=Loigolactobacillus zhaoyuanensis TaxID=2486017 RepID=UPI000F74BB1D|nr:WxL domain-containing protein [Loigolactobacillus zhaoyuanensis]